jgi:hypothetical protein
MLAIVEAVHIICLVLSLWTFSSYVMFLCLLHGAHFLFLSSELCLGDDGPLNISIRLADCLKSMNGMLSLRLHYNNIQIHQSTYGGGLVT